MLWEEMCEFRSLHFHGLMLIHLPVIVTSGEYLMIIILLIVQNMIMI